MSMFALPHKQHSTPLTVRGCLTSPPRLPFVSLAARQLAATSLLGWGLLPLRWDLTREKTTITAMSESANELINPGISVAPGPSGSSINNSP